MLRGLLDADADEHAGHRRRSLPPRRRGAEPPARGAAAPPAGVRRRQGRPAAPARRRAGRRLEHLLGVDARGVPRTARRARGERATRIGRDPATVWRSLGLYALCGEDERDLARRFARLREQNPGVLDATTLDEWRVGRLVGTVDEVREQAAGWAELGVETLILGVGAVPFAASGPDDVALLAHALAAAPVRRSPPRPV